MGPTLFIPLGLLAWVVIAAVIWVLVIRPYRRGRARARAADPPG